jgi:hypothetical protein
VKFVLDACLSDGDFPLQDVVFHAFFAFVIDLYYTDARKQRLLFVFDLLERFGSHQKFFLAELIFFSWFFQFGFFVGVFKTPSGVLLPGGCMPINEIGPNGSHFVSQGLTTKAVQFTGPGSVVYTPQNGAPFAVLDDSRSIDANGNRLPGLVTYDTQYIQFNHGVLTQGFDGACLECQNLVVPPGNTLSFLYSFLAFDRWPNNDFAALELHHNNGAVQFQLLCDIARLIQIGRNQSGWLPWSVTFPNGFQGMVRWVASNGSPRNTPPRPAAARPSCLLVDAIKVI